MNHRQRAKLRVYAQRADIKKNYPSFQCTMRGQPPTLVSRGHLRPTPVNQRYRVRLEYDGYGMPSVYVESPALRGRADADQIPHTYGPDQPCLFFKGDWTHGTPLTRSIIPWLMLWLFFYESWLVTGLWQGGGIDHNERPAGAQV